NILGAGSILLSPGGNTVELRLGRNVTSLSRQLSVGGSGTIILSSDVDPAAGTPASSGPNITSNITLSNDLTLSLSSGTLNGNTSGTGNLTISNISTPNALPIATLMSSNSFNGSTTIKAGSLYIGSTVAASGNSPLGSGSQALQLGTGTTNTY